ncbi:unnamed protein product [Ambrosiozyma monospora]|uniref:Unnamed protein product n=1 Tax=Ambrosiozyma monospora TaxID=43982 RepID=A0A9W7DGS0_AMBMO|nr:unnamed protein product [Ambrosiozyma monospora]
MSGAYTIFGAKVQPHVLSIATLLTVIGGVTIPKYINPAPVTPAATPAPVAAAPAEDLDVEKLLKYVLKPSS